jgi:hypothetical protein
MRQLGVAAIAASLAFGVAWAQLPAMHAEDNGLAVDFTVTTPSLTDIRGFAGKATFTNNSKAPLKIDGRVLAPAALALDFRDATGARVPHCPPPAPPADPEAGRVTLAPGETESLTYDAAICIPPRPGRYQVRFNYANSDASRGDWVGTLTTDWTNFVLR